MNLKFTSAKCSVTVKMHWVSRIHTCCKWPFFHPKFRWVQILQAGKVCCLCLKGSGKADHMPLYVEFMFGKLVQFFPCKVMSYFQAQWLTLETRCGFPPMIAMYSIDGTTISNNFMLGFNHVLQIFEESGLTMRRVNVIFQWNEIKVQIENRSVLVGIWFSFLLDSHHQCACQSFNQSASQSHRPQGCAGNWSMLATSAVL